MKHGQPICEHCDAALTEMRTRWLCTWCGHAGSYVSLWHRGKAWRIRVTEVRGG